jgi:hypothetical protein
MSKLCPEPYFISAKLVQVDVSKYYDKWKAKANNRDTKDPLMYYQRSIAELAYIAMNCCGSNTTQMANSCPNLSDNKKSLRIYKKRQQSIHNYNSHNLSDK